MQAIMMKNLFTFQAVVPINRRFISDLCS